MQLTKQHSRSSKERVLLELNSESSSTWRMERPLLKYMFSDSSNNATTKDNCKRLGLELLALTALCNCSAHVNICSTSVVNAGRYPPNTFHSPCAPSARRRVDGQIYRNMRIHNWPPPGRRLRHSPICAQWLGKRNYGAEYERCACDDADNICCAYV